jgi:hypothetical protein
VATIISGHVHFYDLFRKGPIFIIGPISPAPEYFPIPVSEPSTYPIETYRRFQLPMVLFAKFPFLALATTDEFGTLPIPFEFGLNF